MNESVHGVTEAFLRSDPRFDRSFCSLKVSDPPAEIVAFSCADAAASEIGNKTYSTQSPTPCSGYGSRGSKSVAILGSNASSVDASMERQKPGHESRPRRPRMLGTARREVQDNKNKKNYQMLW